LDGDGNKHKIDADFIKQMKFVDLNGKKRTFVQNSGKLAELKYNGKITWLRESYQYNYSKINTDYLKMNWVKKLRWENLIVTEISSNKLQKVSLN